MINVVGFCQTMESKKMGKTVMDGQFKFKTDKVVVCKYCNREFNYHRSNSSLSYHLRTKHAFVTRGSEKKDVVNQRQPTLVDMEHQGKPMDRSKYDAVTNAIAHWIALNGRPVNIVADEGLQDVLRIASGNQSYTLPSRPVIDSRMTDLYDSEKIKVQQLLDSTDCVALTADYWSSVANHSYLGVTGHIIDSMWVLRSFALTVHHVEDRHYSEACAEHFTAVAQDWGIYDKVTTFGTDNARNMTAAVGQLPFEHMPCVAHMLQLAVHKALAESGVDNFLGKCRKIVGHFKHSPANNIELKHQQIRLKLKEQSLIQDVPTRWNSTLQMIERLLQNKEAVLATLGERSHKHKLELPTESQWEKLRVLQTLLEPSRYATELLGGERYLSCSVVLPTFCHLFRALTVSEDDPLYVVKFKTAFINDLKTRQENCNLRWLYFATALDPRFKKLKCLPKEKREEVWTELQIVVSSVEEKLKEQIPASNTGMLLFSYLN
jgi:zinc finger BED domain-containing protein 1 (E3 SUMO-protein ligase ZBED1)